jgi:hypothetical protein
VPFAVSPFLLMVYSFSVKQRHLKRHSVLLRLTGLCWHCFTNASHYVKGIDLGINRKRISLIFTACCELGLCLKNILAKFKSRLRICQAKIKHFFALLVLAKLPCFVAVGDGRKRIDTKRC